MAKNRPITILKLFLKVSVLYDIEDDIFQADRENDLVERFVLI